MSELRVTAEYPREAWDEQRVALLDAMRRGRLAGWWGAGCTAVVAVGLALVLRSDWSGLVQACTAVGLAALAARALVQRRGERVIGPELRQALARAGHEVTLEQTRLLIRLGTCWSVDGSCLVADVTRPDRVAVVLAPPSPWRVGSAGTTGDGGGAGWGGGAGDCGGGGGAGGDGGGGC